MRSVKIAAIAVGRTADELYPVISDFARYPQLTDAVLGVGIDDLGAGRTGCSWEVRFRKGILRWSEEDHFDPENHRIGFSLIEGDVDYFLGYWQLEDDAAGCRVHFSCDFDMGIPTLAEVIEPIAERTLRENIMTIMRGLLGEVVFDLSEAGLVDRCPQ